jgi:hypothetical protein
MRHRFLVSSAFVVALVALPACGSDNGGPPLAGPNPVPGAALAPADFANLPKPGNARPLDAPVETESSIAQSFDVDGMAPAEVIRFYDEALASDGWLPVRREVVRQSGTRAYWERGNDHLEVTAFVEEGITSAEPTQLDLLLRLK